ncbi:hypothetical protein KM043_005064 [Ampulex compressa]|nr:hypothetical protein KM043_005064 [Ampulex compressa]
MRKPGVPPPFHPPLLSAGRPSLGGRLVGSAGRERRKERSEDGSVGSEEGEGLGLGEGEDEGEDEDEDEAGGGERSSRRREGEGERGDKGWGGDACYRRYFHRADENSRVSAEGGRKRTRAGEGRPAAERGRVKS